MPSPKRRINIELLLGVSATFLSLAALVVSIFQTRIAREQQQKSVLPYLQIRHEIKNNSVNIFLENEGVGPAFIRLVMISHQKKGMGSYNKFIIDRMGTFRTDLYNIPEAQLTQSNYDSLLKANRDVRIGQDWMQGGKDSDAIYAGSAIKEGDNRVIYSFNKEGMDGGPFIGWMRELLADSSYQIRVTYSDVYDNCWQLMHTRNRNKVVLLPNCPPPVQP